MLLEMQTSFYSIRASNPTQPSAVFKPRLAGKTQFRKKFGKGVDERPKF